MIKYKVKTSDVRVIPNPEKILYAHYVWSLCLCFIGFHEHKFPEKFGKSWECIKDCTLYNTKASHENAENNICWYLKVTNDKGMVSGSSPIWKKISYWLSQLPLKGTSFALHLLWSKTLSRINWNISIRASENGAHIDMFLFFINFCFKVRYMYS